MRSGPRPGIPSGAPPEGGSDVVATDVPARLDALGWNRLHTRVVVALGITWVLDGLEVTLAGAVAGALRDSPSLGLSDAQVGLSASAYLARAALGALGAIVLLDPALLPPDLGWRAAFGIGAVLGVAILLLRRHVPESPRWLITHGRFAEAEAIVREFERHCAVAAPATRVRLHGHRPPVTLRAVAHVLVTVYPRRTVVGLVLMASQAFFYNAIFFTWALVLGRFFGVASADVGLYLLPFCLGNFLGPLILGPLFDTVGRRPMIAGTYLASGLLLAATAVLFADGRLDATGQTVAWSVVFFFASAAASSAYLTVGESFPLEMRGLAIAIFYAVGTAVGGVAGPWLFGELIGTGERSSIAWGYAIGSALMIVAAGVQWRWGLDAERRPLEALARPMSGADP